MKKLSLRSLGFGAGFLALALTTGAVAPSSADATPSHPTITVYKDPNCGCCKNWVAYLIRHGYQVDVKDTPDITGVKRTLGVPAAVRACHTAVVSGYLIEGHVPAEDIARLLEQKPKIAGLAVPGMPMGSPGMEGPQKQHYQVLAFDKDGKTKVFASY
jgi:hypothetical protein